MARVDALDGSTHLRRRSEYFWKHASGQHALGSSHGFGVAQRGADLKQASIAVFGSSAFFAQSRIMAEQALATDIGSGRFDNRTLLFDGCATLMSVSGGVHVLQSVDAR